MQDSTRAVVPGTQVRVVPYETTKKLITGPNGTITIQLAQGGYDIFAKAPGFRNYKSKFVVQDVHDKTVPIILTIASGGGLEVVPFQSEDELEIQKAEDSYWKAFESSDINRCQSFWHPDAIAWSGGFPETARDSVARSLPTSKGLRLEEFSAVPVGARIIGDTGVTFNRVTVLWVDRYGRGEPITTRVSHTWTKIRKEWKIIGELSAQSKAEN